MEVLPIGTSVDMIFLEFLGVVLIICCFVIGFRNNKRLKRLEDTVYKLLQGLDDKNYELWKGKLKAEKELKKLKKTK